MPHLILASTSRYRRELLSRLGLDFGVVDPGVAETHRPGEGPRPRAERLARAKATAVAASESIVIGADQVAALDQTVLDKPGTAANALAQLTRCQGRIVDFYHVCAYVQQVATRFWVRVMRCSIGLRRCAMCSRRAST